MRFGHRMMLWIPSNVFVSLSRLLGKSWSIWYFVRYHLRKDKPPCVVWQSKEWSDGQHVFLLSCSLNEEGVKVYTVFEGTLADFADELKEQSTW